jgi:hypothetical protein
MDLISRRRPRTNRLRRTASLTALAALFLLGTLATLLGGAAQAAVTAVPLGTAGSFAVLAGAGTTNTGPTTVNGDVGTYPTTTMTGTASMTITGTNHAGDAVTQGAKSDLDIAYNTAAGEGPTTAIAADLAGQTLTPGVYNSALSIGLTGALTLNAGGDPNAVFVFQAGSTLTTASASSVNLINGAQSCNVFWQVGSSATLGTASTFRGTILALTSITVTTGVTIDGRVLARNGAVTLDTDTITKPTCAAVVTTAATTTRPATTVVTTAPVTTAPVTTAPVTTAPATTAVTTTAPATTAATTTTTSGAAAAAAKKAAAEKAAKIAAAKKAAASKKAAAAKKAKQPTFAKRATRRAGFTG